MNLNPNYRLSEAQKSFLTEHKIQISCGYIGMLRAYQGANCQTIWQTSWLDPFLEATNDPTNIPGPSDPRLVDQLHAWLNEMMRLPAQELQERLGLNLHLLRGNLSNAVPKPGGGVTIMPKKCTRWKCQVSGKNRTLEHRNGFMVCPACGGSYGKP